MVSPNKLGREIITRYRKIMNYTQPELAHILSIRTGERLTAQDVARMEAFGKTNAANPKKKKQPSSAVIEVIKSDLESVEMPDKREKGSSLSSEERRKLAAISSYYQKLGLLKDNAIKPSSMIYSLSMKLKDLEQRLEGDSKDDTASMKSELFKLKEERQKIIKLIRTVKQMIRDIRAGKPVDEKKISDLLGERAI